MIKKTLTLLILAATASLSSAQNSYIPYKAYDGEHKNEVSGYVMGGTNVITDGFGGLEASYTRHIDCPSSGETSTSQAK